MAETPAVVTGKVAAEYTLERDGVLTLGDLVGFAAGLAASGVPNDAKVYAGTRFQHINRKDLVSVHELVVISVQPEPRGLGVQDG